MPTSAKHLIIGSTEAYSGKSTVAVAAGNRLQALGFQIRWGKPLASVDTLGYGLDPLDTDLSFVPHTLALAPEQQLPNLCAIDSQTLLEHLQQRGGRDFAASLSDYGDNAAADILLLEGPSTLEEGALLNLSLPEMATALEASVLLVVRFNTRHMIDQLVSAQKRLGGALLGVILNQVSADDDPLVQQTIAPCLERYGIPVLAILPQLPFLRGIRVSELVHYLDAEVLCCHDHLDLMVESLKIGAMNVNAALRFFGRGTHQAVVTGGDRRDLQIAALETSTHCLVLTGQIAPSREVLDLAEDKEVPVISVATDTLTTVERIDALFGHIPLNNADKIPLVREVLAQKLDLERLVALMGLEMPAIARRG